MNDDDEEDEDNDDDDDVKMTKTTMKKMNTMTKRMNIICNTDDENTRYAFLKTMTRIVYIHYCIKGHSVVRDDDGFNRIE